MLYVFFCWQKKTGCYVFFCWQKRTVYDLLPMFAINKDCFNEGMYLFVCRSVCNIFIFDD